MAVTAKELRAGLIVVTSDGARLGTVRDIGEQEIRVDVRLAPDVSVPLEDLEAVVGELVILNVSLGQLVHREHPPRHI